ncbi:Tricalbin-3 [Spathaspora sp. JA1]|nr:Tricalbin-3 [Spathaspora sp. JA1]
MSQSTTPQESKAFVEDTEKTGGVDIETTPPLIDKSSESTEVIAKNSPPDLKKLTPTSTPSIEKLAETTNVTPPPEVKETPLKQKSTTTRRMLVEKAPTRVLIREQASFSWRNIGNWSDAAQDSGKDKTALLETTRKIESYIIDHFYGDWFWNCSLMLGTCFFAWFVARLGGGILSLGLVLLFTNSIYRSEFRRFNRNIRDDMTRADALKQISNDPETMEWMNSFLDKFWVIYMPAFSEMVMTQANAILKDQAPGFGIDALSVDEFTLGSKAPRIHSIKSYTRTAQDLIVMDWAFSFTPTDTDDMTKNEIKKKIDPKVALGVTVGKGFVSKTLPILVEDMSINGRLKIKIRLSENFPHVKMVSAQFLEAPTIDYGLKPVGGDTFGIDIMSFIPGLSKFVNGIVHMTLRPMFYAPNWFDVDVEELLSGQTNDATAVVGIRVRRAMKLKTGNPTEPNSINPYVQIKVTNNATTEVSTKVKKLINDPVFMETKFILLNNQLEGHYLNFNVFHLLHDKMDDQLIGTCDFPLSDFLQEEVHQGVVKSIMNSGKVVGKLELDIKYFPGLKPIILDNGAKEIVTDSEVGIMKLTLHEARDLDISNSAIGLLNPYAEIYINNELVRTCRRLRQTNEPHWDQVYEQFVTQQSETDIQILVRDSVDSSVVANLSVNLQDVVFESGRGQHWFNCNTPEGPKVKLSVNWKPLAVDDEVTSKVYANAPIGGLRLHLRNATDLKNLESVGFVDPYVRVILNGKLRARTATIEETVNPVWNEVSYLPVANEHQHYLLELMDAEPEGKDRSLGTAAVHITDFLKKDPEGRWLPYDGADKIIEQKVVFNKQEIGKFYYSVSFFPALPVYSLSQIEDKQGYLAKIEETNRKNLEKYRRDVKRFEENPKEFEWLDLHADVNKQPVKTEVTFQDAVKYSTGNMIVHLLSGNFSKPDVFVHTLFDDHAQPSGVSPRSVGRKLTAISTGESFIRDLPHSKLIFRITPVAEVTHQGHVIMEKIFSTMDIYRQSFDKSVRLNLGNDNFVTVRLEYIPGVTKLAPLDTILDVGNVNMTIVSGEDLQAMDSNGKADPFCVVKLNSATFIHKTEKQKKSLDPTWNEDVTFSMSSRSRQTITVEVYDWDYTHDDRIMGVGKLDISAIPPNKPTKVSAKLDTQGIVNFVVTFTPEYIRPPLHSSVLNSLHMGELEAVGSAVFDEAGKVGSAVIGVPGKTLESTKEIGSGIKDMASAIGNPVGSFATGSMEKTSSFMSKLRKPKSSPDAESINGEGKITPRASTSRRSIDQSSPGGPPSLAPPRINQLRDVSASSAESTYAASISGPESVPGRVSVISLEGWPSFEQPLIVKVVLKTTTKEKTLLKTRHTKIDMEDNTYTWNESVAFRSAPSGQLIFTVKEHHTFAKSKILGTAALLLTDISHHTDDLIVDLKDGGKLKLNVKYLTG